MVSWRFLDASLSNLERKLLINNRAGFSGL